MDHYSEILSFWFGHGVSNLEVMNEKASFWWKKDKDFDQEIRDKFESSLIRFANDDLEDWLREPHGVLAIIILADQFSRNIYRDMPDAFAFDAKARLLVHDGINKGTDTQLRLIEQVFFNMPLMHSEAMEDQILSISQFEKIVGKAQGEEIDRLQGNVKYAIAHKDIIERFGRYPHRYAILGRESTAEEIEFLGQPGSSF